MQTLSSGESSYLFSMLSLSPKPRELRSSGFHLLSVLSVKTHTGSRAFSVAVPTLWNSLSERVKSSNSIVSFHHHSPFQTHLSFLSFLAIWSLLMKFEPGLWVCPTPVLDAPLSSILFEDIGAIEVLLLLLLLLLLPCILANSSAATFFACVIRSCLAFSALSITCCLQHHK